MHKGIIVWTTLTPDSQVVFHEKRIERSEKPLMELARSLAKETGFILGQILNLEGLVQSHFTQLDASIQSEDTEPTEALI